MFIEFKGILYNRDHIQIVALADETEYDNHQLHITLREEVTSCHSHSSEKDALASYVKLKNLLINN